MSHPNKSCNVPKAPMAGPALGLRPACARHFLDIAAARERDLLRGGERTESPVRLLESGHSPNPPHAILAQCQGEDDGVVPTKCVFVGMSSRAFFIECRSDARFYRCASVRSFFVFQILATRARARKQCALRFLAQTIRVSRSQWACWPLLAPQRSSA
jgi:hypothetical protein